MTIQLSRKESTNLVELVRLECRAFAAKIRIVRAVLGWSQTELAVRIGLTQRAIHKLEQGETEPRRATVRAIEAVWRDEGIEIEDMIDGSFSVRVRHSIFGQPMRAKQRARATIRRI